IDNIPGAPGIGDKGSVELIKRFGSVEAALDHASEVERKTYRESLLNNRDVVLFSKKMATIDSNVPVELDVDSMRIGQPDVESLRALFTELEFTSLLKELLPVVEVSEARYGEAKSAADVEAVLRSVSEEAPVALALELATEQESAPAEDDEEGDNGPTLPLSDSNVQVPDSRSIAISAAQGTALTVGKNTEARSQLTSALADERLPKSIHDLKTALHALESEDISLRGVEHDSALYSYLLDA